jgi:hypothetical protein
MRVIYAVLEKHYEQWVITIYTCLGVIACDKRDYQTSMKYHEKALKYLTESSIYDERETIGR